MAAAQLILYQKRAFAAVCLGLFHGEDEERPRKRDRKVYMRVYSCVFVTVPLRLFPFAACFDVCFFDGAYEVFQRLRYPSRSLYRENFWLSESLWSTASNSSSPSAASAMFFLICRVAA